MMATIIDSIKIMYTMILLTITMKNLALTNTIEATMKMFDFV